MNPGRIKVALIIATLERGGAEKQLALLATHLDRARFDPCVVVLTRSGPYQQAIEACGVPVVVIGKKTPVSPLAFWRLTRLLKRLRPDVLHTWMFTSNAYGRLAARIAGVGAVISEERCVGCWKGPVRLAMDRFLARWSDRIVANSASVAGWLQSVGIPAGLIQIIPNAFDPSGWPARSVGEAGAGPRLVAMGRLFPQKRYDVLLRAMAQLVPAFPQASLTIAGEGPCRPELEALARELGLQDHVRLPGEVGDVSRLLVESDVFLMASDYEGLPNSVMEAMYVGVPVVATDVPGVRDLVDNGVSGLLAPRADYAALAAAAVSLLRDPDLRRALAGRARRLVLERYSVEKMVTAYEQLYDRCARQ